MQKETKNILWVAVGSFFSGVIITFLLLCIAMAMTRPCHKGMPPMPMHNMHEQNMPHRADMQNHTRGLNRTPRVKDHAFKHADMRPNRSESADKAE